MFCRFVRVVWMIIVLFGSFVSALMFFNPPPSHPLSHAHVLAHTNRHICNEITHQSSEKRLSKKMDGLVVKMEYMVCENS